jgi:peptidoglycan/xylan/chitin deacetylase (PgdA/CDA1 family)
MGVLCPVPGLCYETFSLMFVFRSCLLTLALAAGGAAAATPTPPVEIHQRIAAVEASRPEVALTLDACGGKFDGPLVRFLIEHRIAATLFVTKKWLDRNPQAIALIKQHLDLFAVEDHGEKHIPAVIGAGRKVYGIAAHPDAEHLRREVSEGARAVEAAFGFSPRWYRAATAMYDEESVQVISQLGYKIAGFSVNADAGATLPSSSIVKRLGRVKAGDVIIAHMNHPESDSAKGLIAGLTTLRERGFVFVRLDQVALETIADKPPERERKAPRPAAAAVGAVAPASASRAASAPR